MTMDDKSPLYNVNLCRICQNPNNLKLINTSTVREGQESFLDILKFIFSDIVWVENDFLSVACTICLKKITDIAEFKRLCLETNSERGLINALLSTQKNVKDENDSNTSSLEIVAETEQPCTDFEGGLKFPRAKLPSPRSQEIKVQTKKYSRKRKYPIKQPPVDDNQMIQSPNLFENHEIEQTLPTKSKRHRFKPPKPESKSKCGICGKENFKNLRELERHVFRHNGTRNYICTICGRKYITNGDLITHAKSHSEELKFECDVCNKMFKAARNLQTHRAIVHMDKKDFRHLCTICGNKFVTAERLKEHVKRHNQIKFYPCELCEKSFVSKGEMLRHAATHTNIRAFKCDVCDIEYKQKEFLMAHKSRKHGIGKFRPRLKQSEKPFQCRLCDAKFKCEVNVKPHLTKKHNISSDLKNDLDPTKYYIVLKPPQQNDLDPS